MESESWKSFLQRNRTYLVQNVDFKETELWDAVQSQGIVSRLQVDSMKSNNSANFRQVGAFIDHLLKRTKFDYEKFLYALIETGQDHIAQYLNQGGGGEKEIPKANIPAFHGGMPGFPVYQQQCQPASSHYFRGRGSDALPSEFTPEVPAHRVIAPEPAPSCDIMDAERKIRNLPYEHQLQPCTREWMQRKCQEEVCYPVRYRTRGRAIVITMTGDREGWQADVVNLARMFKYLEFDVEWYYDLKYQEYIDRMERFAQSDKNAHVDCAWVVLMGHGGNLDNKDYIASRDAKPVYIRSTIDKIFNNKICLTLQQKPKAFIVQMCRGGEEDEGVKVRQDKIQADAKKCMKIGTFTDYLIGYATQEGHQALRNIDKGSWYIDKLVEIFIQKSPFTAVTDMLQQVNREVQKFESEKGHVQTTEMISSLNKKFYLFPCVDPS